MHWLRANRYQVLRRLLQASVLLLFMAGTRYGWKVLQGDLSSSLLLGAVPLGDPYALLQVAFTGTLVGLEALAGGLIVLGFFAVVGGRAFCAWVCPMNLVTDLAASLRGARPRGGHAPSLSRNTRYWVMALGLVLSAVLGIAAFEWISPIGTLHRGLIYGMGTGWTGVAAVFLFDLLLVRNGFCGHLCPLGAFYSLTAGLSSLRVLHLAERCTTCMRCVETCPEPQVLPMIGKASGAVTSGECTNCGRCIEVCPEKAMRFGIRSYGHAGRAQKEVTS